MRVTIYFIGGIELTLHSSTCSVEDLNRIYHWFTNSTGKEVLEVRYNMNGVVGSYLINRDKIAYIKIQNN